MRASRVLRTVVLAACVALVVACSSSTTEQLGLGGTSSTTSTVGDGGDEPGRTRSGGGPLSYDEQLERSIAGLQDYWAETFPEIFGDPYEPLSERRLIAAGPGTEIPPCGPYEFSYERDIAGNALWCRLSDFMVWDTNLLRDLYEEFGPFTVSFVLAHEWGHVVQDQAGIDEPTIIQELMADCFAGAWTGHLAEGRDAGLRIDPEAFEQALGGLMRFRDPVGSSPDDPVAHGSGFDRVNAFQEGFEQGAARCAGYGTRPPVIVQLPFRSEEEVATGGDLPLEEALTAASLDLNDYWRSLLPGFAEVDGLQPFDPGGALPSCGDEELRREEIEATIFFCEPENAVFYDETMVELVHRSIGDFGVATLLSLQWVVSAQLQDGQSEAALAQGLQQACFTGSWAAHLFTGGGTIILSAGDLDEAIQAFLVYNDAEADELGSTFEKIQALREGFVEGEAACAAYTEEA